MKNLLIASSLAFATFTALADGSGHQDWLNKASQPARAEPSASVTRADLAQGELARTAPAPQATPSQATAAPVAKRNRAGSFFDWKGVAIPAGSES